MLSDTWMTGDLQGKAASDITSRSVLWPLAASHSRDAPEIYARDVTDPDAVAETLSGSGYYSRAEGKKV